jgi:hypothetical protein
MSVKTNSSPQKQPPPSKSDTKRPGQRGSSSTQENKKTEDQPKGENNGKAEKKPKVQSMPKQPSSKNVHPQKAFETQQGTGPVDLVKDVFVDSGKPQMASANPAVGILTGEITTGFAGSYAPDSVDPLGTKTAIKESLGWSEKSPAKSEEGNAAPATTASADESSQPNGEPEFYPAPNNQPVLSDSDSTYAIDSKGDVKSLKDPEMVNGPVSDDEYALGLGNKKTLRDEMAEEFRPLLDDLKNNVPGAGERFTEYWDNFQTGVKRFDELHPELDKKLNSLKETLDSQGGQRKPENQPAIDELVSLKTSVENLKGFLNDIGAASIDLRRAWLNGETDSELNKAWNAQEPRHEIWFNELQRFSKLTESLGLKGQYTVKSPDSYEALADQYQSHVDTYNDYRNDGSTIRPSKERF